MIGYVTEVKTEENLLRTFEKSTCCICGVETNLIDVREELHVCGEECQKILHNAVGDKKLKVEGV